jgi:hypothetical protein
MQYGANKWYRMFLSDLYSISVKDFENVDFSVANGFGGMSIPFNCVDYGVYGVPKVMVDPHIWRSYLMVDMFIARHVVPRFYDEVVSPHPPIRKINESKLLTDYVMPRTLDKFVHLYDKLGLIGRNSDGSFTLLGGNVNKMMQHDVLEISAAPYGSMVALTEGGYSKTNYFTAYMREKHKDPPYRDKNKVVDITKDGTSNDIETMSVLIGNAILKFKKDYCGNDPMTYPKVSLIVIDIPLHRNSTSSYKLSTIKDRKKMLMELMDDIPLGKTEAQIKLIRLVSNIVYKSLVDGGMLVFKVVEGFSSRVMEALYDFLLVDFVDFKIYLNPYSKELSKEFYIVFLGKKNGVHLGSQNSRSHFADTYFQMMNVLISRLQSKLIDFAVLHGHKYTILRQLICRKFLLSMDSYASVTNLVKNTKSKFY